MSGYSEDVNEMIAIDTGEDLYPDYTDMDDYDPRLEGGDLVDGN